MTSPKFTPEIVAIIRARYLHELTRVIAADLGRNIGSVYNKAFKLGLKKTAAFLCGTDSGRTRGERGGSCRFAKGDAPWNKGVKGLNYAGCKPTQFKPGQMPRNTSAIGSYRTTRGGTLQRKINNNKGNNSQRWRGVHELVWIATNGPVPAKHIVVFKPGMRTNELQEITIDRVECISLAENMKRNSVHNLPKELALIHQLKGALQRQINAKQSDI